LKKHFVPDEAKYNLLPCKSTLFDLVKLYLVIILLFVGLPTFSHAASPSSIQDLMQTGNQLRLRGDMAGANQIKDQLRALDSEDPASYAFNLNTLMTELSWEESQTRFDAALQADAKKLSELCEEEAPSQSRVDNPEYYCGQADFVLSYFNGIRGNYIKAGRFGSSAIDHLEAALADDPSLIRAKMYLGVAYYYADNLPSFIKLFSKVLWFIPTGNSAKSLPYLREVMASDDDFSDVARYIYATLLINGTESEVEDALSEIEILLARYPENARFHLRYVSVLLGNDQYEETLDQINRYMAGPAATQLGNVDRSLMGIWKARAYLGLGQFEQAIEAQKHIKLDPADTTVPAWGRAWYELTRGQLFDLQGKRKDAIDSYDRIVVLAEKTFVNSALVKIANEWRDKPFTLPLTAPANSITPEPGL
jgi:tetratricopeptide (TPR) repeat protein